VFDIIFLILYFTIFKIINIETEKKNWVLKLCLDSFRESETKFEKYVWKCEFYWI
jgi:hypothetical protein